MSGDENIDTGFDAVIAGEVYIGEAPVTVAVTEVVPAAPVGLTRAGVQAARALIGAMPPLTPPELAGLARLIAMELRDRSDILKDFKLTETQYEFLEAHNPFFKAALHAACTEWHAPLNTPERIKVEAAAILEDSLIGLGARMQNKGEGLPGVVEVAKLFAKVAGVGEREVGSSAPGERFTINIDLGGDQKITVASSPAPSPPSSPGLLGTGEGN